MGRTAEFRERRWVQDIHGGCGLVGRKDASFSEMEEERQGWEMISRILGVNKKE